MNQEDRDDIDAERGYSEVGAREQRLRDWFALHEVGEKAGDFGRLVSVLRAKKWATENPERYRELQRRWARLNAAAIVVKVRLWRHRRARASAPITCACPGCTVQWCRVPAGRLRGNKRPKFCSRLCRNRARYQRAKASLV